jgi:8-oxo-dGTP diphosphatase
MSTKTNRIDVPPDYDPSQFPSFAVTVDVVILTMFDGTLHVLLVRRGEAPFEGMWAIPGGFKRPPETLDEAAKRELGEETGVDAAPVLKQFRAYGDPGRDPRMNVVTVAYLAVLRDVGAIVAGSDAADASLIPVADVLNGRIDLAFDHLRILRDAVERVRVELEVSGIATAFVGPTFTMAELRAVYEAIWGVQLDAANFRRSIVAEDGWVIPTGRRARPGSAGGRPAELYRGRSAARSTAPETRGTNHESSRVRPVRTAGGPAHRGDRAARSQGARGARAGPRDDGHTLRLRIPRRRPVLLTRLHRSPPPEAARHGDGVLGRRRGGRFGRHRIRGRRRGLRAPLRRERRVRLRT